MMTHARAERLHDLHPGADDMRTDVLRSLRRRPRRLSSKYFYDAEGSALFEQICRQPEYYLTRAELALMRAHIDEIAERLGPDVLLVEYGSGSGIKTRMLLEHLATPVAYMPVEISRSALADSVGRLRQDFANIEMLPICADFTRPLTLPEPRRTPRRRVIYFPGSTIGNFESRVAVELLRHMHAEMGAGGAALIGVDLVKDRDLLEAAYNDAAGVTARFTLNMLAHFNRALDANFDLDAFAHQAHYNPMAERIETSIVSLRDQDVEVAGETFHFDADERLQVEYSCKYSQASFARLVAHADLRVVDAWEDPEHLFSLQLIERD